MFAGRVRGKDVTGGGTAISQLSFFFLSLNRSDTFDGCGGDGTRDELGAPDDDAQTENTQILIIKYVILDVIMLDYQVKFNVD